MKKLILTIVVAAFAVAVQAGDGACCAAQQTSNGAKATCPMAQEAKADCTMAKQAKVASSKSKAATRQVANKQALKSPKAYAETRG